MPKVYDLVRPAYALVIMMKKKTANHLRWSTRVAVLLAMLATAVMATLVVSPPVFADTHTSTATGGPWGAAGTWAGGLGVPAAGDAVVIASGATVTVDGVYTCLSLSFTIPAANLNSLLTISGTNSLTVTNLITMRRPTTAGYSCTINVGAGTLTAGSLTMLATTATRNDIISISTGTVTISGTFTHGSTGCQFNFTDAGLLQFGGTFSGVTPAALTPSTGTVQYTSNTPVIQGFSGSYYNLTFSGSGTTTGSAAGTITIRGNLANTGGGTLNFSARPVTLTGTATQIIDGFTTTGLLSMTKTAGTATFTGNVNGAGLTLNGVGGTLDLGDNLSHTFTGTFTRTAGTFNLNSSTLHINGATRRTGVTWNSNTSTVDYGGAAQNVFAVTYYNLTLSGNNIKTLVNNAAVNGTLTVNSGVTLAIVTRVLTLRGDLIKNGGTVNGTSGGVTITGTAEQSIAGFTLATGTVSMTKTAGTATFTGNVSGGAFTLNGPGGTLDLGDGLTHTFTGTWTRTAGTLNGGSSTLNLGYTTLTGTGGTFTAGTSTVNFNRGGTQTLPANLTFNNLTLSNTSAKTFPAGTTTVNGILSMEGTATATLTGTLTYGTDATLQYNTATSRTVSTNEWKTPFTATGGVIIANTGTITLNAGKVFNAGVPLTIDSGATLADGGYTLTAGGDISNSGTHSGAGKIALTGGAASHTLSGSGTYGNLELNDANGASLTGSPTVSGILTLTSGNISTGANTLIIDSTGSVSRTDGHIIGNLQKYVATGPTSQTFEIGTTSAYNPVTVDFANVTTDGNLTAKVTAGQHPDIGTSTIDSSKDVNEYWSLTNSGIVFDSYSATFNFVAGDILGGANTSLFIVGRYSSGWTYPTVGTKTATSTQATGLTLFGEFAIGETAIVVPTIDINVSGEVSFVSLNISEENSTYGILTVNVSPDANWQVTAYDSYTETTNGSMTLWEDPSYNTSVKLETAMKVSGNFGEVTLPSGGKISEGTENSSHTITFKQYVTWNDSPGTYRIIVTFIATVP